MSEWEQSGAIKYLGETSNVQPYIEQAHCIVLPSYREGVSRVLLEAAAMERPIIASNVPGCREIVVDGTNGFLCEPQNTSSLIACMMHMLSLNLNNDVGVTAGARIIIENGGLHVRRDNGNDRPNVVLRSNAGVHCDDTTNGGSQGYRFASLLAEEGSSVMRLNSAN